MNNIDLVQTLKSDCQTIRKSLLTAAFNSGGGQHLGGGLSMIEIMVCLYGSILNINPDNCTNMNRDRFVLSKGHGVLGLYPVLHHYGLIDDQTYASYKTPGTQLISHPIKNYNYGIESSNGSLGHGLSYGSGLAYGFKKQNSHVKTYVFMGDGECNEGSVWEAASCASQLSLNNMTCIVDNNGFQSDGPSSEIIDDSTLANKWSAFGWNVIPIDGHSIPDILDAFALPSPNKPKLILSKTIKGKGVNFMENDNSWHHGRLTQDTYTKALDSISSN